MSGKDKTIRVDLLTRVEGEGALYVQVENDRVVEARLRIYEPPRFFEGFLRGRSFTEAPDITARICGICPVAYQMSACHAMEDILGISVEGPLRALRRLLYCGEWIESHTLHIFMLHAPDFLGFADVIEMSREHFAVVNRALQLKKIGNEIVSLVGGREVHPINVRVGGFYRVPTKKELQPLAEKLKWARDSAIEAAHFVSGLPMPEYEEDYEFVALRHPGEYPFNEGRIVSSSGLDIDIRDFENHFEEVHRKHSTALHSVLKGIEGKETYFVGPLARYALNYDRLSEVAKSAARRANLETVCRNPFQSIVVRAVEVLEACEEALRIIDEFEPPDAPFVETEVRAGSGCGCTEAPRGMLYHRYEIDETGAITHAKIVPPTSQNQRAIERDLRGFVEKHLDLPDDKLTWQCEQAIRNYDPCISCSTHSLKLHIYRS